MADYIGPSNNKIKQLEKERSRQQQKYHEEIQKLQNETQKMAGMTSKFAKNSATAAEERLKKDTIGLVTLEDFQKRQIELEQKQQQLIDDQKLQQGTMTTTSRGENGSGGAGAKKSKKRKRELKKHVLSFQEDLEQEEQQLLLLSSSSAEKTTVDAAQQQEETKRQKLEHDPSVSSSILLPDRERDEEEQRQREILKRQWLEQQEQIKQEEIDVTYSYWDGTGHRKSHKCKKGTTIESFLYMIQPEWKELKRVAASDLMFIKEDVIIPHHYSFYDLIISKARGVSGPLFLFDVRDDIRLVSDASVETEESHAAKVVERRWYEQNKNKFPVCRWEFYTPEKKDYSRKYTIKGSVNNSS